jgi:hypothetical protein
MPTLEIMGRRVQVGDEFTQLSPEAQQTTVNEIAAKFQPTAEPANKPVAIGSGEKQYAQDRALLGGEGGAGETAKAFAYPALNAALFNVPSHVAAATTYAMGKKPYSDVYKEQKEYEAALERQHPTASTLGTGVGIVGGLAMPLGVLGRGAQAAKAAAETAGLGAKATKAAELAGAGATAAGLTGVSSGIETLDPAQAAKDALIGGGLGAGLHGVVGKVASKFAGPKTASSDDVQQAIDAAVGKGKLTAKDIPGLDDVIKDKGATPEAVRQALLADTGVATPTRSMVTNIAAPSGAKSVSEEAIQQAKEALAARAEKFAGEAPPEGAIGEALHGKLRDVKKAAGEEFEKIPFAGEASGMLQAKGKAPLSQTPVQALFSEDSFGTFVPSVQKILSANRIPIDSSELSKAGYTQTAAAMKYIEEGIGAGQLPLKDPKTRVSIPDLSNFEAVRKALRNFSSNAKDADKAGMSYLQKGFDEAYDNALLKGMYSGDGKAAYDQLQTARGAWKDFKDRFYAKYGQGGTKFMSAINSMADQSTGQIAKDIPIGAAEAAQKTITSGLLDPKLGEAMYARLEKSFGKGTPEMDTVTQQIRSQVLTPKSNQDFTALPKVIDKFLAENPKVAERAFSGQNGSPSIADLRKLSESIKIISSSKKSEPEKQNLAVKAVGYLIKGGLTAAMGTAHGFIPGAITYATAEGLSKGAGALRSGAQRASELAGAPVLKQSAEPARTLVRTNAPYDWNSKEPGYAEPKPLVSPRMGRKSGGRVSDKLIREVERARKSINSDTESLLNTPDDHVAHALEIANRNLEG